MRKKRNGKIGEKCPCGSIIGKCNMLHQREMTNRDALCAAHPQCHLYKNWGGGKNSNFDMYIGNWIGIIMTYD